MSDDVVRHRRGPAGTHYSECFRIATRSTSVRVIAVGAVLLFALTGCTPSPQDRSDNPPRGTSSASTGQTPSPGSLADSSSPAPHDLQPTPTAAAGGAPQVALEAMGRFCRPRSSKARWIADLDPFLTLEAASAYATVDPARVQCSRVAPPARILEGDGFTQVVTVHTNKSAYRITLSRSSLSDPWLVFRIAPTDAQ